jgi:fatty acid desaturase
MNAATFVAERRDVAVPVERAMPTHLGGEPLPSPLRCERLTVPSEIKKQLLPLMRPDLLGFLMQWARAWIVIAGAIGGAIYLDAIAATILAIVIVATRQNVLGLLMHEQAHWLGSRRKWMDFFSELFVAYPVLVTLEGYRRVHWTHHIDYFTPKDPDFIRKQGEDWTFPQQMSYFLKLLLKDITGINMPKTLKAKQLAEAKASIPAKFDPPRWLRPLFFVALIATLTLTHTWTYYLLYWIVPLFTVMQVIIRWGAVTEHKYNLLHPSVAESTPLIELRWWERVLLPNLNFTLHIYHHWFPNIPQRHLPRVHALFKRGGMVVEENVFHGYESYFWHLMGRSGTRRLITRLERSKTKRCLSAIDDRALRNS